MFNCFRWSSIKGRKSVMLSSLLGTLEDSFRLVMSEEGIVRNESLRGARTTLDLLFLYESNTKVNIDKQT